MSQTPTEIAWAGLLQDPFLKRVIDVHEQAHGPINVTPPANSEIVVLDGARRVLGLAGDCGEGPLIVLKAALESLLQLRDQERKRYRILGDRLAALGNRLHRAEEELAGPMRRRTEDLRRQREQLEEAAMTDSLTGVFNRRAIEMHLREAAALCEQAGEPLTVLMVDIDFFKRINDEHGHLVGDQVLAYVGRALKQSRRRNDVVGRWGGEEFLIALPGCPLVAAERIAEEVRAVIEGLDFPDADAEGLSVTTSVGYAVGQVLEGDLAEEGSATGGAHRLVAAADENLYAAKREGRNRAVGQEMSA